MTHERTPQEHRARHLGRHARRARRWRDQAARLINLAHGHDGNLMRWVDRVVRGEPFDVARVRSYCERLIAEADALDIQREVFADWTRAQGMGPEDRSRFPTRYRRFAVTPWGESETPMVERWRLVGGVLEIVAVDVRVSPDNHNSVAICCIDGVPNLGGWPGSLAREYVAEERARRKCSRSDCDGGVLLGNGWVGADGALVVLPHAERIACPECKAFAATRTPRAFVNGGNLRRAAQRLLDTLDGRCPWTADAPAQPSECTSDRCCYALWRGPDGEEVAIDGHGWTHAGVLRSERSARLWYMPTVTVNLRECAACNGTGHNLRGMLPPLPVETTRRLDSGRQRRFDNLAMRIQFVDSSGLPLQRANAALREAGEAAERLRAELAEQERPRSLSPRRHTDPPAHIGRSLARRLQRRR